jgi:hypothetical protein
MRIAALIAGASLGVLGVALVFGALGSDAGLGPVELVIGLIAVGIGVLVVRSARR